MWVWESEHKEMPKNWCFWIIVLLDSKEIKPISPKGNQTWLFIGRLMLKLQYFGHLMQKADSLEKTLTLAKKMKVTLSCLTLCNPMDYTIHGILQARMMKWVAGSLLSWVWSQLRDQTQVSHIVGEFLTSWAIKEAWEYWSG